jgi:cobalt/nickel transport system ATP-binding protein
LVERIPIFRLEQVGYRYPDGVPALSDVTLDVMGGERLAIVGANGSGKSTLLKLLDALIFPTEGRILAFGRALTPKEVATGEFALLFRRRVGLVFQDPDVQLFSPTVEEEVAFGPRQLGYPEEETRSRVERTLEWLSLDGLRHRPPYRLSGGEKRKVALASVLSLEPDVLLLDEPTAGLDARTQGALTDLIHQLHEEGKTVVTATHDLSVVRDVADRVYVLGEDHRPIGEGTPEEVLGKEELLLAANLIYARDRSGLTSRYVNKSEKD